MADVDRARRIVDPEHGGTGFSDRVDRHSGWLEARDGSQPGRPANPLVVHCFETVGWHRQDDADRLGGVKGGGVLHVHLPVFHVSVQRVGDRGVAVDVDCVGCAVCCRLDDHRHGGAGVDTGE